MTTRALHCPHCARPHPVGTTVCPLTHRAMPPPDSGLVIPRPSSAKPPMARPSARRALIGQTIDGKYRVRGVIGEGGMGSVFEAEQINIRRLVAIKVLHPAQAKKDVAVKRFHQEARAVGSIGHPNICEVYDMGALEDGSPYLVLERLTGQTLSARMAAEGQVSPADAVDIFAQVASGLVAAHDRGILHRDIKPENVFLSHRPGCPAIVKLLDFGVSKVVATQTHDDFDDETLTKTGMVMGTPYYMAPEQARGERDLDGRVDVYACGVVMYEILAGRRPFGAANYNALLLSILTGTPPPLRSVAPAVPPALERLVAKAMSRSRDDRFASAEELRQALVDLASRMSQEPPPESGRATMPMPVVPQAASMDVPVSFVDSAEVVLEEDGNATTTTARRPMRLDYDDAQSERTQLMTPEEIASRMGPQAARNTPDVDQSDPSHFDEETARMGRDEVEAIAAAIHEARENERQKR